MDELIILEIEGRATPDQLDELRRWRSASEEHARRYQEIAALWALSGVREEIEPSHEVPSSGAILRPRMEGVHRPRRRIRWLRRAAGVAAVLIIGIGLGHFPQRRVATDEVVTAEFRAGPNELATAVLQDGSVARLAPNTTLRATMGNEGREVHLDGRAFFAVARDPDRPFRVRTAGGEARVLGTRFEVDTRRNGLRLLVVDGRVALSAGGVEVKLGAGEMGEAPASAPPSVIRVEVPEALLDWMGAWVAFEATPLWKVARELEARLGVQLEILDPEVASRAVSGWFDQSERDQMLSMICRVADVRCRAVGDLVQIED